MKSTITGWGKCIPDNVVTNDDLATFIDTSDEWIQQRTGVKERRFCHVNNSDMATVAGLRAVACAGLKPEEIDVVILATCTPDSIVPSAAAHVQQKNGMCKMLQLMMLTRLVLVFFMHLEQAKAFVESGLYKNAVVIGSEHITWLLNWSDRNTAVLFGDAAGAVVVEESKNEEDGEIYSFSNGMSSDKLDILEIPNFGSAMNRFTPNAAADVVWTFEGQEIFKSGIRAMAKSSEEAIEKSGLKKEDIDILIPHQANVRIIEGLERTLKLPNATTLKYGYKYGNTSAASIPTALVDAIEDGTIKGSETLVITAVGAGLTWGGAALKFGKRVTPLDETDVELPPYEGTGVDVIRESINYFVPEKAEEEK
ncbi:MAG: beta-ketoacyl-ACP synthase III [Candidatus Actinomarina sp.]